MKMTVEKKSVELKTCSSASLFSRSLPIFPYTPFVFTSLLKTWIYPFTTSVLHKFFVRLTGFFFVSEELR